MKKALLSAACLLAIAFPVHGEVRAIYTLLESESYSEIAPIKQLLDDLKGPAFDRGDLAFTHNQFEIGERRGSWEVSAFLRYDYLLEFSNDTAELAYVDKNDKELEKQRNYQLYLEPNHLRAKGLGLAYYIDLPADSYLKLRANYLRAEALTDGTLRGQLRTLEDRVEADLVLDYNYSRDALLKREEENVRGNGLSIDIDLHWQFAPQWTLDIAARDLASEIRWNDVTYTRATAISNTVSYDDDGFIDVKPTVSGIEGYRDHSQPLPRRIATTVSHQWRPNVQLSAGLRSVDKYLFPQLNASWVQAGTQWQVGVDIEQQALMLGVNYQGLKVNIKSDAIKPDDAKAFGLSLSYQWLL